MPIQVQIHSFSLKMFIAAVTLTEAKLIWLMDVGLVFNRCIYTHDKNLPNLKTTVYANFPVSYVKTLYDLYDPGNLVNRVKVKLMTSNNRPFYYAHYYQFSFSNGL